MSALQCHLCPHRCLIQPRQAGRCGVRINLDGKSIQSVCYGRAVSAHVDHVENRPFYHYLPGSPCLVFGSYGCNFSCKYCSNWSLSCTPRTILAESPSIESYISTMQTKGMPLAPRDAVQSCTDNQIPCIAFTFSEPTVWLDYCLETCRLAKEQGLRTLVKTNGFMTSEAWNLLEPVVDALNVDLKGFSNAFYSEVCGPGARVEPVLETIHRAQQSGKWVEVSTVLIEGLNDTDTELRRGIEYLAPFRDRIPWHLAAFCPTYQMIDGHTMTSLAALEKAKQQIKDAGHAHVFLDNVSTVEHSSTYCANCAALLVQRDASGAFAQWGAIRRGALEAGGRGAACCAACGHGVAGVWE